MTNADQQPSTFLSNTSCKDSTVSLVSEFYIKIRRVHSIILLINYTNLTVTAKNYRPCKASASCYQWQKCTRWDGSDIVGAIYSSACQTLTVWTSARRFIHQNMPETYNQKHEHSNMSINSSRQIQPQCAFLSIYKPESSGHENKNQKIRK